MSEIRSGDFLTHTVDIDTHQCGSLQFHFARSCSWSVSQSWSRETWVPVYCCQFQDWSDAWSWHTSGKVLLLYFIKFLTYKSGCWLVAYRAVETIVNLTSVGSFYADCNCTVLVKEMLPSGLYVDTYQTDSLHQCGAAKVSFFTRATLC